MLGAASEPSEALTVCARDTITSSDPGRPPCGGAVTVIDVLTGQEVSVHWCWLCGGNAIDGHRSTCTLSAITLR